MANQFAKDKIDFNVYERADPDSQVDWGKAAQDITKTFEGIRDVRQGKKAELEKMITEQQDALNDIGSYDSPTLQQVALDASNDSANKLNDQANLMRRGLIKPHEMQKFKANQSSGWTQFKKNAEGWDGKFKEYTERMQGDPPPGSGLEMQLAQSLEGFNNLKNLQFMSNAETGEMSYARLDDKGDIIPGESVSINQMTNLLNQKVDAFDLNGSVLETKGRLGKIITATISPNGIRTDITTEEMSRAEKDYFDTNAGQETLKLEAAAMTAVPQKLAVMMTTNVTMPDGKLYEGDFGGKKHDAWAKENPDADQSLNPFIAMRYDGNQYVADVTAEQKTVADAYAEKIIKTALDVKQTATSEVKHKPAKNYAPKHVYDRTDKKDDLLSQGKNVMFMVTGDADEAAGGIKYLVDGSNGQISGIQKTPTGFIINYPNDSNGNPVDPMPINTEGKNSEQGMRLVWKAAGMEAELDRWLDGGGRELLEDREVTYDAINVTGATKGIKYDAQAPVTNSDGDEVTVANWLNNSTLGESLNGLNDDNDEVVAVFSELLSMESFFPKGIGNGKVSMDGDDMTFTIDGTPYDMGDVFAMETAEVGALMREKIQQHISKRKKGGKSSKHNKNN